MQHGIFDRLAKRARQSVQATLIVIAFGFAADAHAATELAELVDSGARIALDSKTGVARFIGFDTAAISSLPGDPALQTLAAQSAAQQHLAAYGALFGLSSPFTETQVIKHAVRDNQRSMTRFQQYYQGVPVIGGELIVNQTASNQLSSIGGKVSPDIKLDVTPVISAKQAEDTARQAVSKWYSLPANELNVTPPVLSIYDSRLISPHSDPITLVWRMDVAPIDGLQPIREFIGIDANTGLITIHFNQAPHAKNRLTYDKGGVRSDSLPGATLSCNEGNPNCTGGSQDAIYAHQFAGATYDYYLSNFGRDSIDGLGMSLISTVRFCYASLSESCPYQNAFWNGSQMVYGTGFSKGEDVVAHELTHGVTSRESNLFYYYQSGAINESLSDVFGELIQQSDPLTTVTPATKWMLGEDLSIGAIRNMANPPAFGDPDRMTSASYTTSGSDNGGVHTNSGINNKAAFLMTDGGSFNGKTIVGLGRTKVTKIYYEAQTNLLTSGSDYLDLSYALYQACQNLVNSFGITASDCQQVKNATDAVEMTLQPVSNYNPEAGVCPAGLSASNVFTDTFEAGTGNWTTSGTSSIWILQNEFAQSGVHALFGYGYGPSSPRYSIDGRMHTTNPITLPAGAYLRFDHSFEFEAGYDGGIVEYSTDGVIWNQLTTLLDGKGFYSTPISSSFGNPIGGKLAFSGTSHGYVSSRFNLAALSGPVRFRWHLGTDSGVESYGWFVDNVRVYSCANLPPSAAPVINSITAGAGSATINFSAPPSNSGAPITGYTASCSASGQLTRSQSGSASPITVKGLTAGVAYSCRVTADNSAGSSPPSSGQTVIPSRMSFGTSILMLLLD